MNLTERDFALFDSAAAPVRAPVRPDPRTKPRREPIRPVRSPREETIQTKKQKAQLVWRRTLVSYMIVSAVSLCLFLVIQSETEHHRAMVQQSRLESRLSSVQQRNIKFRADIEHMYSLEIIQDIALNEYHMVPVEGGRVTYLNILRGDQLLN